MEVIYESLAQFLFDPLEQGRNVKAEGMETKTIQDLNIQIIAEMTDLIRKLGFDSVAQGVMYSFENPRQVEETLQRLKDINAHFSKSDAIPVIRVLLDKYSITRDEI